MVHTRQFLFDHFRSVRQLLLDPRNIQKHAAVRTSPPGLDLAHDAACHVVAGQQLRRTARALVALCVTPPFFFVVGGLALVVVRNVVKHEAPTFVVAQHAAFATHALCYQNPLHTRRPYHPRRVKLDEFHILQRRTRVVCERLAIRRVLPAVAGDAERPSHSTGRQHHGLALE